MASVTSTEHQVRWWVPGDWNAFFGLFTNVRSARWPGPVVGGRGVLMLRHPLACIAALWAAHRTRGSHSA